VCGRAAIQLFSEIVCQVHVVCQRAWSLLAQEKAYPGRFARLVACPHEDAQAALMELAGDWHTLLSLEQLGNKNSDVAELLRKTLWGQQPANRLVFMLFERGRWVFDEDNPTC
jgi:hypothetical protein